MPWHHVIIGSRCSWLHGDSRGFRSREHRIHSSGDYKNRPPKIEHAGLRRYHQRRSGKPVNFRTDVCILILREFVCKMRTLRFEIIACSIGKRHLHALTELPLNYQEMKRAIGKCKQKSSHAVRKILPGIIWAEGNEFNRIKDRGHLHNAYDYIRTKQEPGTVVWSHNTQENWIDDPSLGVVVMGLNRKHIRVFGVPQTPVLRYSSAWLRCAQPQPKLALSSSGKVLLSNTLY
jgi:REP element-mobilizing transposase RayT